MAAPKKPAKRNCLVERLEQTQNLFLSLVSLGHHAHTLQCVEPNSPDRPALVVLHVAVPSEGMEDMRSALEAVCLDVLKKYGATLDTTAQSRFPITPKGKSTVQ